MRRVSDLLLPTLFTLVAAAAAGAAPTDEGLVGTWEGTSADNRGERVVLAEGGRGSFAGEELTWKAWGAKRLRVEVAGETLRGTYVLDGDRLVVAFDGLELRYERRPKKRPKSKGASRTSHPRAGSEPANSPSGGTAPAASADVPPALQGVGQTQTVRYEHPQGHFAFALPRGWSVAQETEDLLLVNPGFGANDTLEALILVSWGRLELEERNLAPAVLLDAGEAELRNEIGQQGIRLKRAAKPARAVLVGDVPGAIQEWDGATTDGQVVRLWLGGIVKREHYLTVGTVLLDGKAERFLPGVKQIFESIAPNPPERNSQLERMLAGRKLAGNSTTESGSLSTTYELHEDGSVKRSIMFSGATIDAFTSCSTDAWGHYEVIGDLVYFYFQSGQETGAVVVEDGVLQGVRFGNKLYGAW